jgi:hypothetical protein
MMAPVVVAVIGCRDRFAHGNGTLDMSNVAFAGKPLSLLVVCSSCIICPIQAIWANIASVKLHCITRRPDRAADAR